MQTDENKRKFEREKETRAAPAIAPLLPFPLAITGRLRPFGVGCSFGTRVSRGH